MDGNLLAYTKPHQFTMYDNDIITLHILDIPSYVNGIIPSDGIFQYLIYKLQKNPNSVIHPNFSSHYWLQLILTTNSVAAVILYMLQRFFLN